MSIIRMDFTKIVPLIKRVIITPYEGADTPTVGYELSKADSNPVPVIGTITKVSTDSAFKVGEIVLFRKFGSDALKFQTKKGEEKVYLVEDSEILGVYKNKLPK